MGLLKNLFGGRASDASVPPSQQFHETEDTISRLGSVNAPRRELVHMALRETVRRHSIPSDWIDCRILSVLTRKHKAGMHVQFIILKGEEQLLEYVHAFQESFLRELEKYDSKPRVWLFSVGWQFEGQSRNGIDAIPEFDGWSGDTLPPEDSREADAQDTQPPDNEEQLETDLKQLFAIRDAAMSPPPPTDLMDLPQASERPRPPGPARP